MKIDQRINAFHTLGQHLAHLSKEEFQSLAERAANENPWFTEQNVRMAFDGIKKFLTTDVLHNWTSTYSLHTKSPKKIALIMAGNIPLVGFHDFLSVLVSGHKALIKLSSKDSALMSYIIQKLMSIEPQFESKIEIAEQLRNFDAVIATGSDNSARYFDYYFGKYPNIIRKNRTSVAVLSATETHDDLKKLGLDIFTYFGMGCRNVSKLYVPSHYDFATLFQNLESYGPIIHHHKYCNNYDYQKSILLVNTVTFLDNDFVLLQESEKMVSPIAVLYYEHYDNPEALKKKLDQASEKIQCIVGNDKNATVKFGEAQFPSVNDYADRVDTLTFLSKL